MKYNTPLSFKVATGFSVIYLYCITTNAMVMKTGYTYSAYVWFLSLSKKLNKSKSVRGKICGDRSDDNKSIYISEIKQSIDIVDARYLYKLREMK